MTFYKFTTGVVALGLAACAAYFSVIGIASLMGANFWQVAVMAGFLEAGKLVCASAAYRFRKVAPTWIRGLFITFTGIMMLITSLGIFGFLSSSYQKAASERDVNQQQVENVESKLQTFKSEVARLKEDRQRLISEQQELQETRAEQGWLSKRQDQRLSNIPADLSETDSALTASRDSVLSLQSRITNLESSQNEEAKLGPIIFVANTVGLSEDSAALYFIMLLIFVFDPMAVTLVVALSMATDFEETVTEEQDEKSSGERILDYDPAGKKVDLQEVREMLGKPLPDSEKNSDEEKEINVTAGKIDTDKLRDLSSQDGADEESGGEEEVAADSEFLNRSIEEVVSVDDSAENATYEEDVESENDGNNDLEEDVENDEEEMSSEVKEWFENARSSTPTTRSEKPWENPFRDNPFGNFDSQQ
jgi:hypothetical protein